MLVPDNVAILHDWLTAGGQLFVHLYFPHTAGMDLSYLVRSLADVKHALSRQPYREIAAYICRKVPYETVGDGSDVLDRALGAVAAGAEYEIVSMDRFYPFEVEVWSGDSVTECREHLTEVRGRMVGISTTPLPWHLPVAEMYGPRTLDLLYLEVSRNQSRYEAYWERPDEYRQALKGWSEA
jgi:hypothetical protein